MLFILCISPGMGVHMYAKCFRIFYRLLLLSILVRVAYLSYSQPSHFLAFQLSACLLQSSVLRIYAVILFVLHTRTILACFPSTYCLSCNTNYLPASSFIIRSRKVFPDIISVTYSLFVCPIKCSSTTLQI